MTRSLQATRKGSIFNQHYARDHMPRFLIERTTGALTADELEAAARRSNAVLAEMDGVA